MVLIGVWSKDIRTNRRRDKTVEGIRLLVLRLTERCNLRCAYCYAARDGETPFDMDEDTALRAVELCCPPGGTLRIQFTGGEPLLKLELMEAVAAFGRESGRKLLLSVQTNGTLLTAEVCRRLKAIRCGVGVSLDGPGEANALRVFPDGRVSTESVIQGIQNLGEAGMRCGMTTVVTAVNAARLGELPDLALWLGNVAGVGLDLFRPLGRGAGRDLSPVPAKLAVGLKVLRQKTQALSSTGIPFRFRELERIKKRRNLTACFSAYCYAQTGLSLAVDGKGRCWPCSSLAGREDFLLGSIWDGLPGQADCGRPELGAPASCRACASFSLCLGGCPAGRLGRDAVDPLVCAVHQALTGSGEGGCL